MIRGCLIALRTGRMVSVGVGMMYRHTAVSRSANHVRGRWWVHHEEAIACQHCAWTELQGSGDTHLHELGYVV